MTLILWALIPKNQVHSASFDHTADLASVAGHPCWNRLLSSGKSKAFSRELVSFDCGVKLHRRNTFSLPG
ncbi:hypothetical protein CapIbe_001104 [Capra ibex]